jgi:hypothetical protein
LRQNLQQVAPNQEKPHTTPLHSLIYSIYISVEHTERRQGYLGVLCSPACHIPILS